MNINISAPINSTGYGIASTNIIKALHNQGNTISYFPIGQPSVSSQEEHDLFIRLLKQRYLCDINAPYIKIWHQFDLLDHVGKGKYIAFPFFELDTFNEIEVNSLKVPDIIFTTSHWGADIISRHVSTPTKVVPLGVDLSIFNESNYQTHHSSDKYIFINIGKWEVRKGHDILLELFTKAFPDNPNVELWILASETTNGYSSPNELQQWKQMYDHPNIKLYSGFNTHQEIAHLISQTNCGLFPSRAEGWNLELLECMAMNKPVITTNFSAHTEFCNQHNSYLVDITAIEKAYDGKAFAGQGNWAKIDNSQKDDFIDKMRYVVNKNIRINTEGVNTARQFSWINTAQIIQNNISSI